MSDSMSESVNDSGAAVEPLKPSRAPAEQGAGSRERGSSEQGASRSTSRNMALRSGEGITAMIRDIPQAAALARLVLDIRPDWNPVEVFQWASSDPRPWGVVVAAGIGGARNPGIRFVGGLAKAGPLQLEAPPTYPSVREALAANDDDALDEHGFPPGRCPFCRHGIPLEEGA